MRLYQGTAEEFIRDATRNEIADKLKAAFENYYGHRVNPGEFISWTNSLQFLKTAIQDNSLTRTMMILEYELPYCNERIDCILFGKGESSSDNVVILELKQWSKVEDCDVEDNVITFVGGAKRMVAHPSFQVRGYHYLLKDFIEVFDSTPLLSLSSCVYCHNLSRQGNGIMFSEKFESTVREFPIFTKEDFEKLGTYLKSKLAEGAGLEIFNRFVHSNIRPSKKLIEYTSHMIKGQKVFTLIDEQLTANNTIIDRAKKASKLPKKTVIIVNGGPGTGKSVIALNAIAELLSKGITVFHATGSAAFTTTLKKVVGTRVSHLFKYFSSFGQCGDNELGALICDEAHRIRETSQFRFTKREHRTNTPQIEELIRAAKVSIFFIDEYQIVRPTEVGSVKRIRETAEKFGAEVFEFDLKTQFRCSGSDGYLNWIDNTLGIKDTANRVLTKNEKMEFRIFDTPQALYEAVKEKNDKNPNSARLVAGFCWPWSDPNPDGTLKEDVVIGDFRMTWEAKNDAKRLAPRIPKANLWAYDPNGVNQVGSIYTIQGFEFEYVGVIFGKDLVYDWGAKDWKGNRHELADASVKRAKSDEDFVRCVKNVYRTLLTRGMKGIYVHFMDKETEKFFKSRMEQVEEATSS